MYVHINIVNGDTFINATIDEEGCLVWIRGKEFSEKRYVKRDDMLSEFWEAIKVDPVQAICSLFNSIEKPYGRSQ